MDDNAKFIRLMDAQNDEVKIRLAEESDFQSIHMIWLEGVQNSFDISSQDTERLKEKFSSNFQLRSGIFNFWVATDLENIILGWQSLVRASNNPFRYDKYAESSTYVAKNVRHKGIGKLLIDFVMMEAEKSSLNYVVGFVTLANEESRKMTELAGFFEIGVFPLSKKVSNEFPHMFLVRPV